MGEAHDIAMSDNAIAHNILVNAWIERLLLVLLLLCRGSIPIPPFRRDVLFYE
jgi:hypothetical protein